MIREWYFINQRLVIPALKQSRPDLNLGRHPQEIIAMARPTFAEDQKTFMSAIRKHREPVGNGAFRSELGWNEDRYWKVRTALIETGRVIRGRGRGGSVRRAAR